MRLARDLVLALVATFAAGAPAAAAVQTLYAGSYTSGASKGIYAWRFDDETGALTALGLAAASPQPAHIWIAPKGRFLYAVNWETDGGVSAFQIDQTSGRLTFLNRVTSRGSRPNQIVLDPSGRVAVTVNYGTGNVVLYRILVDGRLSEPTYEDRHSGGLRPTRAVPRAHGIVFSRDSRWMYVAELGLDRVYAYRIDPARASAQPVQPAFLDLHSGSGPRRLQLSADGRYLYVNHETDSEVSVLSARSGHLIEIQRLSTVAGGSIVQNSTAEIVLGKDGQTLYVSNRGSDTIATYRVNRRSGRLALLKIVPAGGMVPRNLRVDPSGRFLLSANEKSGTITVLPVGPDGVPGQVVATAPIETPGGMFFAPRQGAGQ